MQSPPKAMVSIPTDARRVVASAVGQPTGKEIERSCAALHLACTCHVDQHSSIVCPKICDLNLNPNVLTPLQSSFRPPHSDTQRRPCPTMQMNYYEPATTMPISMALGRDIRQIIGDAQLLYTKRIYSCSELCPFVHRGCLRVRLLQLTEIRPSCTEFHLKPRLWI